ncbi:MAG: GerMN domain-containing protein [Desulfitobacteriaceae bacterium]|nr:GerMN domain-containing protein [Desulfitobacteriaceae bacterium]MDD4345910.1 GerMN domain-containing protein [Desulfitobacteriaceae bacterium]MDD4402116.1 GerMN domain-containing protein [Desulfitobacteriaceae bacterium]
MVCKRVILISLVILLSGFLVGGCGTLDALLQKNNVQETIGNWIGEETSNAPEQVNQAEGKTVTLYFADSSGKYLIEEERMLPKTLSVARETVIEWLKGPAVKDNSSQTLVSPSTSLIDISIKDGVATVDLSKEFLKPYQQITPELEIYGLVNTLTQFSTVREVCLRIEGKTLNKLGNIETRHLVKKPELIKNLTEVGSASGSNTISDSPSSINLFAFPSGSI